VGMGAAVIGAGSLAFLFLFFGHQPYSFPSTMAAGTSPPKGGSATCVVSRTSDRPISSIEGRLGGGSSSNQGVVITASSLRGVCAGRGPVGGAVVLYIDPRNAEREPIKLITTWQISEEAVPTAEAAWMHRERDLVRMSNWSL